MKKHPFLAIAFVLLAERLLREPSAPRPGRRWRRLGLGGGVLVVVLHYQHPGLWRDALALLVRLVEPAPSAAPPAAPSTAPATPASSVVLRLQRATEALKLASGGR